ncbi:hypothetical protein [Aquirufa sp.]|jgi:hypothetical protein|uniref:hypothetical protein n=1 Tax=Aquirufa sp. TaxID=2676249 RepID=UPI0037BF705D
MKATLFRGEDVNHETFDRVHQLLQAIAGMNVFVGQGEPLPLPDKPILAWKDLFEICQSARENIAIESDTFIFVITEKPNERNFFGYLDPVNPRNGFVHAGDWERFIHCPAELPVAYHILALMLQHQMVQSERELAHILHKEPVGCVNDFCQNKREVILKMRTADICPNCMELLAKKLSPPEMNHVFELLESLRIKMLFAQNMRQHIEPSPLVVTSEYNLVIPAYGNLEIRMTPLEKTLYLLYMRYPEGIHLTSLVEYKTELQDIYANISSLGSLEEMRQSIDDMCNALNNSASEKLSKIKGHFERVLGKELAKHYYIHGSRGERKRIGQ